MAEYKYYWLESLLCCKWRWVPAGGSPGAAMTFPFMTDNGDGTWQCSTGTGWGLQEPGPADSIHGPAELIPFPTSPFYLFSLSFPWTKERQWHQGDKCLGTAFAMCPRKVWAFGVRYVSAHWETQPECLGGSLSRRMYIGCPILSAGSIHHCTWCFL